MSWLSVFARVPVLAVSTPAAVVAALLMPLCSATGWRSRPSGCVLTGILPADRSKLQREPARIASRFEGIDPW